MTTQQKLIPRYHRPERCRRRLCRGSHISPLYVLTALLPWCRLPTDIPGDENAPESKHDKGRKHKRCLNQESEPTPGEAKTKNPPKQIESISEDEGIAQSNQRYKESLMGKQESKSRHKVKQPDEG